MGDRRQQLLDRIERMSRLAQTSAFFERITYAFLIIKAETELAHLDSLEERAPTSSQTNSPQETINGKQAL